MTFTDRLTLQFMSKMLSTREGRVHFLTQVADAENNDEGRVFEALKERAKSDPQLFKMVARHAADEERHAELLGARADATGLPRPEIPETIKLLHRLDEALGGFFSRPIETDEDVMRMYLLLQVIEERAVTQFPIFKTALAAGGDADSAKVFEQIEQDEERHLKYCQAIARRYAPNAQVHEETLQHFRRVEAQVFAKNSAKVMQRALELGLHPGSWVDHLGWRAIGLFARLVSPSRPTAFAGAPVGQPELAAA